MEVKICFAANVEEALKALKSYLGSLEFHQLRNNKNDYWGKGFKEGYLTAVKIMMQYLEVEK